jgi:hypothetical protein
LFAIIAKRFVDLSREFPRWYQNERSWLAGRAAPRNSCDEQSLDHWQRERRGLACAGLCASHDVATL